MAVFSKGLGLINDIFCSRPFLSPLIGSKTSKNFWNYVGISQNTFQDTKSTEIGLLDRILARGLKKPKKVKFVCFLVRVPSVRFLETVPFDPQLMT